MLQHLLGGVGHVGDQVVAVLGLLETGEGHLGAGDVLLGVLEVLQRQQVVALNDGGLHPPRHKCLAADQRRPQARAYCRSPAPALTHLEESLSVPGDALVDVGGSVREAVGLSRLAAEDAVEVGADLVGTASLGGVALSATGLEDTGTLANVACGSAESSRKEGLQLDGPRSTLGVSSAQRCAVCAGRSKARCALHRALLAAPGVAARGAPQPADARRTGSVGVLVSRHFCLCLESDRKWVGEKQEQSPPSLLNLWRVVPPARLGSTAAHRTSLARPGSALRTASHPPPSGPGPWACSPG